MLEKIHNSQQFSAFKHPSLGRSHCADSFARKDKIAQSCKNREMYVFNQPDEPKPETLERPHEIHRMSEATLNPT